jgi:hypothetical protein
MVDTRDDMVLKEPEFKEAMVYNGLANRFFKTEQRMKHDR